MTNNESVVISTRIRLARNYKKFPFLPKISDKQASEVMEIAKSCMLKASSAAEEEFRFIDREGLEREGGSLLEKHLISPNMLHLKQPCGVIVSKDETISVMLNEEDHIRIQVIAPGYDLRKAYQQADQLDNLLEEGAEYAFHEHYGYLTSCPTNIGTGLRASVMLHLPAIVMADRMNELIATVSKFGITVRGIYGEGSEALGNLFQFSNQVTLGLTEKETIDKLENVVNQIIDQEIHYRQRLKNDRLIDKISRSYGILKHAYLISYQEFMNLWSDVRLGVSMGILPDMSWKTLNDLLYQCGPYTILYRSKENMDATRRDKARAEILKKALQ